MHCEDIRDKLIDVTTADLMSTEPRVRQHLEMCEQCRDELRRATRAWSLLTAIPDEEPDSSAMRQQFVGILTAFRQIGEKETVSSLWRAPLAPSAWRPLYVAAAMLLALLAGGLIGRQLFIPEHGGDQALDAMRQELRDVREMLTLSLLQQSVASDRIKGVSSAGRLDDPRADVLTALIDALLHDPNVNVRLACIRALGRFKDRPAIREGVVEAVVREQSPLVTIALISFIVEAKDEMAIDALRHLSQDAARDDAVRDTAARGVERLLSGGRI